MQLLACTPGHVRVGIRTKCAAAGKVIVHLAACACSEAACLCECSPRVWQAACEVVVTQGELEQLQQTSQYVSTAGPRNSTPNQLWSGQPEPTRMTGPHDHASGRHKQLQHNQLMNTMWLQVCCTTVGLGQSRSMLTRMAV